MHESLAFCWTPSRGSPASSCRPARYLCRLHDRRHLRKCSCATTKCSRFLEGCKFTLAPSDFDAHCDSPAVYAVHGVARPFFWSLRGRYSENNLIQLHRGGLSGTRTRDRRSVACVITAPPPCGARFCVAQLPSQKAV
jgi:hypothetical protein